MTEQPEHEVVAALAAQSQALRDLEQVVSEELAAAEEAAEQ